MFFEILLSGLLAFSMTEVPVTMDKLIVQSQVVVDAIVERKECFQKDQSIYTRYTLRPMNSIYQPTSFSGDKIVYEQLGGELNGTTSYVAGYNSYEVGDRRLFFFYLRENGAVGPVSHQSGTWNIEMKQDELQAISPSNLGGKVISLEKLKTGIPKVINGELKSAEAFQ